MHAYLNDRFIRTRGTESTGVNASTFLQVTTNRKVVLQQGFCLDNVTVIPRCRLPRRLQRFNNLDGSPVAHRFGMEAR